MQSEWRWLLPLVLMTVFALAVAQYLGSLHGVAATAIVAVYVNRVLTLAPFVIIGSLIVFLLVCALRLERAPLAALRNIVRRRFPNPAVAGSAVIALLLMPVLMGAFGALKMLMPLSRSFDWDDSLALGDKMLFLGFHPWQLTHALFGGELATMAIDLVYAMWVPTVFVAIALASVAPPLQRARFFLTFGASWLLIGVFGAYALASAGPCYAALIGASSAPQFAPMMDRLHEISTLRPLNTVVWQSMLWNAHVSREYQFAMGISAMPSMHNAITVLYALMFWNSGPLLRYGSRIYVALIFIGSIHLGWHYALDGIIAGAATVAIFAAVNVYLRWCGYAAAVSRRASTAAKQPASDTAPALG